MPICTVIRTKRLELGLTQEQVAERLGVTAPAVNKWEKGTTYPDMALVAPLARLLRTDVNTLLCFQEMTEQEIGQFANEMGELVRRKGFPAAFEAVMEKLREYPACDQLTYSMAMFLEGALLMSGLAGEERAAFQRQIEALYERVSDSEEQQIRDGAAYLLSSRAIQQGDYQKAEALLDRLPERSSLNKCQLKASLLLQRGEPAEAAKLLERTLLNLTQELQITLLGLLSAVQKEGDSAAAEEIAAAYRGIIDQLGLWEYGRYVADLEVAVEKQDAAGAISVLETMLQALLSPWKMNEAPLFRHIAPKGQPVPFGTEALPGLLAELEHHPKYEFLQREPAFRRLLKRYQAKCK